jgi:hypothetical protein
MQGLYRMGGGLVKLRQSFRIVKSKGGAIGLVIYQFPLGIVVAK